MTQLNAANLLRPTQAVTPSQSAATAGLLSPAPNPQRTDALSLIGRPLTSPFISDPGIVDRVQHAGSQALGAAIHGFGAVPTALAEVTRLVRLPSAVPRELHRWGDAVRGFSEELFPGDPRLQGDFWWDVVPEALGSFGSFIAVSYLGLAVGGPPGALVASLGMAGATGIADQSLRLRPFVESGELDPNVANLAAIAGVVPGLIQALPVMRGVGQILGKTAGTTATKAFGQSFLKRTALAAPFVTKEAAVLGVQEGLVETVGVIGQNAIEKFVANPKRGLLDGAGISAGAGGVAGFITGVATSAVGLRRQGKILQGMSQTEVGRRTLKEMAVRDRLLSEQEADQIGDDMDTFFKVVQNRMDDKEVAISEDADGSLSLEINPDLVTRREHDALDNPELSRALQRARRAGIPMEELFETGSSGSVHLSLPEVRRKGYNRSPETLTADSWNTT